MKKYIACGDRVSTSRIRSANAKHLLSVAKTTRNAEGMR